MRPLKNTPPAAWVPTLYFAEGLPYVVVMSIAVVMYKNLGLSNTDITLYTSWLYLPWVIKPLWSPIVDILTTQRRWIIAMQALIAIAFSAVAFLIPTTFYVQSTLAVFWVMAFASATHDIAADGFYITALKSGDQSLFIGIRNTFYRLASITGQGLLVMLAGTLAAGNLFPQYKDNMPKSWRVVFFVLSAIFLIITLWHLAALPQCETKTKQQPTIKDVLIAFGDTVVTFFKKRDIALILFFILTYRLGEAQLCKIAPPFMLDDVTAGGLNITTEQVGLIYGTVGVIALLLGGILGGIAISVHGFKRWILPMAIALNLPDLLYIWLAQAQPDFWAVLASVTVEQFGYGFGFTAFSMYLIHVADGEHKTAHYAFGTGLMALGMMLPGMIAGWIEEQIGYTNFFIWVCVCTIPGLIATMLVQRKLPTTLGKKEKTQ